MLSSHNWLRLISPDFNLRNLFTLNWEALGSGLTSFGGLQPATESLWMSDIAHHHLAVGVVFILAGHMYQTDFGIGVALGDIIADHKLELFNSCHLQLALQLAMQGSVSVWVGHVLVALPAYPYLLTDYATVLSVFTHHQWIGGIFIVGGAAHASMALIFDCSVREHPTIVRLVHQRRAVIVHLNWVCIFLGFHSFGLYIHNDTVSALGRAYDQFSDQGIRNLFTLNWEALGSGLTSFGGLQPATESLCASVTDVLGFVLGWRVQGWCQIRLDLASDSRVMVRVVEAHARYPLGITYSSDCSGCTTPYLWWSSTSGPRELTWLATGTSSLGVACRLSILGVGASVLATSWFTWQRVRPEWYLCMCFLFGHLLA